jgi:hypothetical protein
LRVGIRVTDASILGSIRDCLPPVWKASGCSDVDALYSLVVGGEGPRPGLRRLHLAYRGSARIARSPRLAEAIGAIESDLRLYVAQSARRRVFVHAGVVGWRGRAILLPGHSAAGKSSLVAALVRAGATYYSDEYAVLDPQGRVHPFPAPLSLRGQRGAPSQKLSAESLGGAGRRPLPVGLVAFSRHEPGARWRPRGLTLGQAVLALLAHTIPARRRPAMVLPTLGRALSGAVLLRGRRGEAVDVAGSLLRRLGREAPAEPQPA